MALKLSWPAVSHICSFTARPSQCSVFAENSSPTVGSGARRNCPSVSCSTSEDLPTPESPTTMYLKR